MYIQENVVANPWASKVLETNFYSVEEEKKKESMNDPMKRPCSTERIAAGKSKVLHPEAKTNKDDSVQSL